MSENQSVLKRDESGVMIIDENAPQIQLLEKIIEEGAKLATMKNGIVKGIRTGNFIQRMKAALTPEIMQGIMALQNTFLGFKTDKPEGYPVEVVATCVIEAYAVGLTTNGNEFNIISGSMYVAKNGTNALLRNMGVRHFEEPGIPELFSEKEITYNDKYNGGQKTRKQTIYKQPVSITWVDAEGSHTEEVSFLINVNNAMGPDAIAGKAVRKARMWLVARVTGMEIPDAEVEDTVPIDVTPKDQKKKTGLFKTEVQPAETAEATAKNDEPQGESKPDEKVADELAAIDSELQAKGITDITAADIKATCERTGNKFVASGVVRQLEAFVKWVRHVQDTGNNDNMEAK